MPELTAIQFLTSQIRVHFHQLGAGEPKVVHVCHRSLQVRRNKALKVYQKGVPLWPSSNYKHIFNRSWNVFNRSYHRAYASSKMYRELKLRGAILTMDKQLKVNSTVVIIFLSVLFSLRRSSPWKRLSAPSTECGTSLVTRWGILHNISVYRYTYIQKM